MIERHWDAEFLAKIIGGAFVLIGLIGFVPNPLLSETGFFQVNAAHNVVHLGTGAVLLAAAFAGAAVMMIRIVAVLYAIVAVLGFVAPDAWPLSLMAMNAADHWVHAMAAVFLLFIAFAAPMEERVTTAHM